MKATSSRQDNSPIFILTFIVCLPTLVGLLYRLLH